MLKKQTIYRHARSIKQSTVKILKTKHIVISTIYSISIIALTYILVLQNYENLKNRIPFFYIFPWGEFQLTDKSNIWIFIMFSIVFFIINTVLSVKSLSSANFYLSKLYSYFNALIITLISVYTTRIVFISTTKPIIFPQYIKLIIVPLVLAMVLTYLITPYVIKFAKNHGFVDDPLTHKHPAMLLTKPIPRAGGLAFYLGVITASLLVIPIYESQKLIGILLGSLILVLTGLRDDKKDINPYLRLFIQFFAISIVVLSGIILMYLPNPFGDAIKLADYRYVIDYIGEHKIHYFSVLAAIIWIWWTMNFMSFANGVDGVYAGLVTIVALIISIVMYKSIVNDADLALFTKFAAIIAGAGIGMAFFTWPPQKILWGWGATAAGLMIAALSIIGSTKIAVTLIVLMIPFLDGVFAIIRRLSRKQMPFFGDREHFHHKLLDDFGWNKQKIAMFYWSSTIILATIGILTSGKTRAIAFILIAMVIIIVLAFLNFGIKKHKNS